MSSARALGAGRARASVDLMRRRYPELTTPHHDALVYLAGTVWQNEGAVSWKQSRYAEAIGHYGSALQWYSVLRLDHLSMEVLSRIASVAAVEDPDVGAAIVNALAPCAVHLDITIGDATDLIQRIYKYAIASAAKNDDSYRDIQFALCHLAKGLRFGRALHDASPSAWRDDKTLIGALTAAVELEADLPSAVRGVPTTSLRGGDEPLLLTAFTREGAAAAGHYVVNCLE